MSSISNIETIYYNAIDTINSHIKSNDNTPYFRVAINESDETSVICYNNTITSLDNWLKKK